MPTQGSQEERVVQGMSGETAKVKTYLGSKGQKLRHLKAFECLLLNL